MRYKYMISKYISVLLTNSSAFALSSTKYLMRKMDLKFDYKGGLKR